MKNIKMQNLFSAFKQLFITDKPLPETGKPAAIAFVDYEHWYISMTNIFHMRPQIEDWYNDITTNYELAEIVFFGDFTGKLRQDLDRIRAITNIIIDTQNPSMYHEKDYTDFIMLDYIYRKSISIPLIENYIIFSGDGHFTPVANFLQAVFKKNVIIYGIKNAFSQLLKNAATKYIELPYKNEFEQRCIQLIIENFDYVASQPMGKVFPTFQTTCEFVSRNNNLPFEAVKATLKSMIDNGYVCHRMEYAGYNDEVRVLCANWDMLIRDGLWEV